jgi:hypothetical protein
MDGQPIIFDCIEYNDAFRQIDVLSERGGKVSAPDQRLY